MVLRVMRQRRVLASLGVVADPQYVDADDTKNCDPWTRRGNDPTYRRYRATLPLLKKAVAQWRREPALCAVLQMGDLIDGRNCPGKNDSADSALAKALGVLEAVDCPLYHVVGNNEIRNFSNQQLAACRLRLKPNPDAGGARCCEFRPCAGWRVIILDSYLHTFCEQAHTPTSALAERKARARVYLKSLGFSGEPQPWPQKQDMWDPCRKYNTANGAFGRVQLQWLRRRLKHYGDHHIRVIVATHCPVHPLVVNDLDSCNWDNLELMRVLAENPAAVAFLAGHDHEGGYCRDANTGVHHLTVPAVLQAPPNTNRFLTIDLHRDCLVVRGEGECKVEPGQWYRSEQTYQRYKDLSRPLHQRMMKFGSEGVRLALRPW